MCTCTNDHFTTYTFTRLHAHTYSCIEIHENCLFPLNKCFSSKIILEIVITIAMAEKKILGTSYIIEKIDFLKINKCNIYYNYIIILLL